MAGYEGLIGCLQVALRKSMRFKGPAYLPSTRWVLPATHFAWFLTFSGLRSRLRRWFVRGALKAVAVGGTQALTWNP